MMKIEQFKAFAENKLPEYRSKFEEQVEPTLEIIKTEMANLNVSSLDEIQEDILENPTEKKYAVLVENVIKYAELLMKISSLNAEISNMQRVSADPQDPDGEKYDILEKADENTMVIMVNNCPTIVNRNESGFFEMEEKELYFC